MLVDIGEAFQLWRFRHMKTSSASALDQTYFPELIDVRGHRHALSAPIVEPWKPRPGASAAARAALAVFPVDRLRVERPLGQHGRSRMTRGHVVEVARVVWNSEHL
jgi:hypothetical protein